MRTHLALLTALINVACIDGAKKPNGEAPPTELVGSSSVVQTARFRVEELTCEGCAANIKEILEPLDGVLRVETNVKEKTVVVEIDTTRVTMSQVVGALAREKYIATVQGEALPSL